MAVEEAAIRAAMSRRLAELKASAAKLADVRPYIAQRPLTSCLVAAGAGLALGMLAGGRRPGPAGENDTRASGAAPHSDHQTIGAVLAAGLVPALQPMLRELIHSGMGSLARGHAKSAEVASEAVPTGLSEDNKVVE
jgi:hypothetical protein